MDHLEGQRLLQQDSRADLLGNALTLIGPAGAAPLDLGPGIIERLGDGRVAMALVNAVPAGVYGKAALETLGLWQEIAPKVAQTDNVRAALALVALGEASLGIVYHYRCFGGTASSTTGTVSQRQPPCDPLPGRPDNGQSIRGRCGSAGTSAKPHCQRGFPAPRFHHPK